MKDERMFAGGHGIPRGARALTVALVTVAALASCRSILGMGDCTDDLITRVDPRERSVRVGAGYAATASAWSCGGTRRLADEWRYYAVDTTVVRVDSLSGQVTGRAAGSTEIRARGQTYGETLRPGRVTVMP